MGEEIMVTFDEAGNPEIQVKGHKGKGCKALTEALERALGKTTADKTTPEYNMTAKVKHVQR